MLRWPRTESGSPSAILIFFPVVARKQRLPIALVRFRDPRTRLNRFVFVSANRKARCIRRRDRRGAEKVATVKREVA